MIIIKKNNAYICHGNSEHHIASEDIFRSGIHLSTFMFQAVISMAMQQGQARSRLNRDQCSPSLIVKFCLSSFQGILVARAFPTTAQIYQQSVFCMATNCTLDFNTIVDMLSELLSAFVFIDSYVRIKSFWRGAMVSFIHTMEILQGFSQARARPKSFC